MKWFKRELLASRATWKIVAAGLPVAMIGAEAKAQSEDGTLGGNSEIADLLAFIKRESVTNLVWITADMHYTAAHLYHPNRARFQDFDPFWEFVSGPLHAGTWAPAPLDDAFGPSVMFAKGCGQGMRDNLAPCFGLQFFGHVAIDAATEVMTVTLKDVGDRDLWSTEIEPAPRRPVKEARRVNGVSTSYQRD